MFGFDTIHSIGICIAVFFVLCIVAIIYIDRVNARFFKEDKEHEQYHSSEL